MQSWQPLQDGDIVDIIAPGWSVTPEVLKSSLEFLESWNLKARLPKNLFKKNLIASNTDETRWSHLQAALMAKDSKVIWCLRGGYGSIRLVPNLAKMKKPLKTKLLIGISDITSLHNFFNHQWQWPSLHGALLDRIGQKGKVAPSIQKEMKQILWGKSQEVIFKKLKPVNKAAEKVRRIKASIVGGNLATLQPTLGTPYEFDLKNKFLFLEDIGERGYKLDRMLVHFQQAGKLKDCKGILLGHFTGGDEPQGGSFVKKALLSWANESKIPVFSGMESGHDVNLRPVPFMTEAILVNSSGCEISIQTGAL